VLFLQQARATRDPAGRIAANITKLPESLDR
jgi:hypothetical protein